MINKIKFEGPFSILGSKNCPSIFSQSFKQAIYLWTLPYKNENYITYVGKTERSIQTRFLEHIKAYLSGDYEIVDIDQFSKGKKVIIWKGAYGHKGKIKDAKFYIDFFKSFSEIHKSMHLKIVNLLQSHIIYVAPIKDESRFISRTEAAIYRHLLNQKGFIGEAIEKDIIVSPRWPKEKPITLQIIHDKKIIGLPNKLEI